MELGSCLMLPQVTVMILMLCVPRASSAGFSFDFPSFLSNATHIEYEGDAFTNGKTIQLTKNQIDGNITGSAGRASYASPVRLWDAKTRKLTDFLTHFSFAISQVDNSSFGDGLTFFIAPFSATIPPNSDGGSLALFDSNSRTNNTSKNQIVAVEFDTFQNDWDPKADHVGIDINSIVSVKNISWNTSIKDGRTANAWISYNSTTQNLTVYLTYALNPVYGNDSCSLWYQVDLRTVLPELVRFGFSAATGNWVELHKVISWTFYSSLDPNVVKKSSITWLIIEIVGSVCALSFSLVLLWLIRWRKKTKFRKEDTELNVSMDSEFEKGTGPKRFTYAELSQATKNYSEDGKLGEGGFGGVYKGSLGISNLPVAVKRVSRGSKQGKKEYISEVRIISRLRHRNLVQLIGWCHEQGEFLLVYELMPNGSLDSHLFGGKTLLTWPLRVKIAHGLASALLYLHEEWEQCVVHRDVKSSNIMLDSGFNAKLGDFGLARLVDHGLGSQTTVLAGTMGYLAPECVTTGKASKESDVYSFGVVALEIACGRRPVEPKAEPSKVRLIEWVWGLYGKGQLLEAADEKLNMEYDEGQLQHLMVVGLWCCHPDHTLRPSIRQVISVLNFEAPLPSLPSKLPVPMYYAPPMDMCKFSYTSSVTYSEKYQTNTTTNSSLSAGSSKSLLHSPKADA